MADAPFGARSHAASTIKSPKTQVGRFVGSSWTLARRSNCLHGRAVGTAGDLFPFRFRVAVYRVARWGVCAEFIGRVGAVSWLPAGLVAAIRAHPSARPGGGDRRKAGEGDHPRPGLAQQGATPPGTRRSSVYFPHHARGRAGIGSTLELSASRAPAPACA